MFTPTYQQNSSQHVKTGADASVNCCCAVADNMEEGGDKILRLNKSVNN